MTTARALALALSLAESVTSCDYVDSCAWPRASVYTSDFGGADHLGRCCATMPPHFLTPAEKVGPPPGASSPQAFCAADPRHDSYYPPDQARQRSYLFSLPNSVCTTEADCFPSKFNSSAAGVCAPLHPFYTQYVNAFPRGGDYRTGVAVLGSDNATSAALDKTREVIAEMLRQVRSRQPAVADAMALHHFRFFIWAEAEYGPNPKCPKGAAKPLRSKRRRRVRSSKRPGRDPIEGSAHPEIPCGQEPGGADDPSLGAPTGAAEEMGICFSGNTNYVGRLIVIEEFFHSLHSFGIKSADPEGLQMIYAAADYAWQNNLYLDTHDPTCWMNWNCYTWEMFAAAVQVWFGGIPFREDRGATIGTRDDANKKGFLLLTRAELKQHKPIADALARYFDDMNDYNPCAGVVIDEAYGGDEFGQTCASLAAQGAPGSALCGGPLSPEYIGQPYPAVTLSNLV